MPDNNANPLSIPLAREQRTASPSTPWLVSVWDEDPRNWPDGDLVPLAGGSIACGDLDSGETFFDDPLTPDRDQACSEGKWFWVTLLGPDGLRCRRTPRSSLWKETP